MGRPRCSHLHRVVRPRHDDEQIARDRRGGGEPEPAPISDRAQPVRQDRPGRIRGHAQRDRPLEIELIEAGEQALGDVQAEIPTDVPLPVHRVGEGVQTFAVGDVSQPRVHDHLVRPGGQAVEWDPTSVVRRRNGRAVERHLERLGPVQLEERIATTGAEPHGDPATEGVRGP